MWRSLPNSVQQEPRTKQRCSTTVPLAMEGTAMRTATLLLLALLLVPTSYAQSEPAKWQVATIMDTKELPATGPSTNALRYEVTLRVEKTEYVIIYTEPSASKGVPPYRPGQDFLIQIGPEKIKYNDMLGRVHEVPILRHRNIPADAAATKLERKR
jgi:hypothetical protein